jgi:hypothetical protein
MLGVVGQMLGNHLSDVGSHGSEVWQLWVRCGSHESDDGSCGPDFGSCVPDVCE